ncbi:AsnC family transcriptional regulator [Streptomyces sp. L7]
MTFMSSDRSLDAIDRAILLQLARNGRLTNVELAQRVGLSPRPACAGSNVCERQA